MDEDEEGRQNLGNKVANQITTEDDQLMEGNPSLLPKPQSIRSLPIESTPGSGLNKKALNFLRPLNISNSGNNQRDKKEFALTGEHSTTMSSLVSLDSSGYPSVESASMSMDCTENISQEATLMAMDTSMLSENSKHSSKGSLLWINANAENSSNMTMTESEYSAVTKDSSVNLTKMSTTSLEVSSAQMSTANFEAGTAEMSTTSPEESIEASFEEDEISQDSQVDLTQMSKTSFEVSSAQMSTTNFEVETAEMPTTRHEESFEVSFEEDEITQDSRLDLTQTYTTSLEVPSAQMSTTNFEISSALMSTANFDVSTAQISTTSVDESFENASSSEEDETDVEQTKDINHNERNNDKSVQNNNNNKFEPRHNGIYTSGIKHFSNDLTPNLRDVIYGCSLMLALSQPKTVGKTVFPKHPPFVEIM